MSNAKKFIGAVYLKGQKVVDTIADNNIISEDPVAFASALSDSNVDEIIVFDLTPSGDDKAHEAALDMIKDICKAVDVNVTGAGNVKRMEDIKKLLYAGCRKACLNYKDVKNADILQEVSEKFGRDKIVICFDDAKVLEENKELVETYACEAVFFARSSDIVAPAINLPLTVLLNSDTFKELPDTVFCKYDFVDGVTGNIIYNNLSQDRCLQAELHRKRH